MNKLNQKARYLMRFLTISTSAMVPHPLRNQICSETKRRTLLIPNARLKLSDARDPTTCKLKRTPKPQTSTVSKIMNKRFDQTKTHHVWENAEPIPELPHRSQARQSVSFIPQLRLQNRPYNSQKNDSQPETLRSPLLHRDLQTLRTVYFKAELQGKENRASSPHTSYYRPCAKPPQNEQTAKIFLPPTK